VTGVQTYALPMLDKCGSVCGGLCKSVVCYKLIIGGRLQVVTGLELPIEHVIFFHPHKSSVGICFAHRVASAHLLFVGIVFGNIPWPVLLGIIEFLPYFFINILSLKCLVDLIDGL